MQIEKGGHMQDCLFCSHCKTTLEEFLQTGLIGCAFCYIAFKENLLFAIEKTQGKTKHIGKRPPWSAKQRHIFSQKFGLRNELSEAIKQKNNMRADVIYKTLKDIATLEELYDKQMQLERIIVEKEELERIEELQNRDRELSPIYIPKESERWKEELHALKYEIQELEKEICG